MKVESDTTRLRSVRAASAGIAPKTPSRRDAPSAALADAARAQLPGDAPGAVASAPGRLDVMGGFSAYSGAHVVTFPMARHVVVACEAAPTGTIEIRALSAKGGDTTATSVLTLPLDRLADRDGGAIDRAAAAAIVNGNLSESAWCVLGTIAEMLRARLFVNRPGGLLLVVGSSLSALTDAGEDAAICAAALAATARAHSLTLEPVVATRICHRVQNLWLDRPVGAGDAACVLYGASSALTEFQPEPCTIKRTVALPDRLELLGIDSGRTHPASKTKFARARTAAFMGRSLIARIIEHEGENRSTWNRPLASITVGDFVRRFRDRIPTKLRGSEYLERFGETGDPLTRIDPDAVYKIRSRTEHHIYEHDRARRFMDCLAHAENHADPACQAKLTEAGELMYASHWSYGQRCGLGSVETDLLVNLIRKHGEGAGVLGAKISGRGCGGVVTVLMRSDDAAAGAIDDSVRAYQERTGTTAIVLRGSSPGALHNG